MGKKKSRECHNHEIYWGLSLQKISTQDLVNIRKVPKSKRKVQGVPQSQAAVLPRHQEEEKIDKTKTSGVCVCVCVGGGGGVRGGLGDG